MKNKVVVIVRGGLIQFVGSNIENIELCILDHDNMNAANDIDEIKDSAEPYSVEPMSEEQLDRLVQETLEEYEKKGDNNFGGE